MWAATERKWRQSPWQPPEERPTNQQTMQHTTFPGEPFEVRPWVIQSCPLKFLRPVLECLWVSRSECLVKKKKKKKREGPQKTLCYSPLCSFKASVAECAREPASRVTATSKFPPCAISLQEMLTAAGGDERKAPAIHHTWRVRQTEPCQKSALGNIAFLCQYLPRLLMEWDDGMRHGPARLGAGSRMQPQSFSATSCSSARRHFLPASDHGCRLLWVSHAPCPSKQFVFGGAADLALNFSSRQKKKKKKKGGKKKGAVARLMLSHCCCLGGVQIAVWMDFRATQTKWFLLSFFSLFCFFSLPGAFGRAAAGCGRGEEEVRGHARYFLLNYAIALQYFSPTPVSFVVTKHSRAHPSDATRNLFENLFCCLLLETHPSSREPTWSPFRHKHWLMVQY